jgi:hypothetical protein
MTMLGMAMRIFLSASAASACPHEHSNKQMMFVAAEVILLRRRFFIWLTFPGNIDFADIFKP